MLPKRSISPLIATILLIVVSVILVTVILTWGSDFAKSNAEKANTFLDQSKTLPKSTVFWLDSLIGNKVILKNNNNSSIEIKGYKILTTDFNSDYFWLNSYRPLENNVLFTAYSINPISLVCVPEKKFFLELIDINDQPYSIEINPKGNSSYTKCNAFYVPLWEFEEINGSYEINEFKISEDEFADRAWGYMSPYTIIEPTDNFNIKVNYNQTSVAAFFYRVSKSNLFEEGKKYKVSFKIRASGTILNTNFNIRLGTAGERYTFKTINLTSDFKEYEIIINIGDKLDTYTNALIFEPTVIFQLGDWYEIKDLSIIEIDPLPTITDGTKYLECTTAGAIAIPSNTAYGTWEFDVYKFQTSNQIKISFISLKPSPIIDIDEYYWFHISGIDSVRLLRSQYGSHPVVFNSPLYYINSNTFYRIKITRSESGEFTMYIKGGSFGDDYVLVDTTGGVGINPRIDNAYTTSNYFVIDLDPGDKIANIKISPEIE